MAHWRETYKPARFFAFDARAGIPILGMLLHIRWYTVTLVIVILLFFWFLERKGLSVPAAFRAFRGWVIGDFRPARRKFKIRRRIDYDRREL